MKQTSVTIKKAIELLEDMRQKDQEAFDSLITNRVESKNPDMPVYSILGILNKLYATEEVHLGVWYTKETNKTDEIISVDKKTREIMKDGK